MVAYYYHDISAWMDGTEGLSDGEYRVYHVICQMIYQHDGAIVVHETGIAGRCNQHVLAFRANLRKLIEKDKLILRPDRKITNRRVEDELTKITKSRARKAKEEKESKGGPGEVGQGSPGGSPEVAEGSAGGRPSKRLKNKDPTLFEDPPLINTIGDNKGSETAIAVPAAPPVDDPRTKLFRAGLANLKSITGRTEDSCRALLGSFLKLAQDDAIQVLGAIDDAKRNEIANPVPWIKRALETAMNGGQNGNYRQNGGARGGEEGLSFAALAVRRAREARENRQ